MSLKAAAAAAAAARAALSRCHVTAAFTPGASSVRPPHAPPTEPAVNAQLCQSLGVHWTAPPSEGDRPSLEPPEPSGDVTGQPGRPIVGRRRRHGQKNGWSERGGGAGTWAGVGRGSCWPATGWEGIGRPHNIHGGHLHLHHQWRASPQPLDGEDVLGDRRPAAACGWIHVVEGEEGGEPRMLGCPVGWCRSMRHPLGAAKLQRVVACPLSVAHHLETFESRVTGVTRVGGSLRSTTPLSAGVSRLRSSSLAAPTPACVSGVNGVNRSRVDVVVGRWSAEQRRGMHGSSAGGGPRPAPPAPPRWRRDGGVLGESFREIIRRPSRARDVLAIVQSHLLRLTPSCVGAAVYRLGKMATSRRERGESEPSIAADDTFKEMMRLARRFGDDLEDIRSPRLGPGDVAMIVNGLAKLHDARWLDAGDPRMDAVFDALEAATRRSARALRAQEVSMIMWGYAKMCRHRVPSPDTWKALDDAVARVEPGMIAQGVTNIMWAYAKCGWHPGRAAWAALDRAARREMPYMKPQEISNLVWAYGTLESSPPSDETWNALNNVVARVAPAMVAQGVCNTAWGFSKLEKMPSEAAFAGLIDAGEREAPRMNSQNVANYLSAMGTFAAISPDEPTWGKGREDALTHVGSLVPWAALEPAVLRAARSSMNDVELASTLRAHVQLRRRPGEKAWEAFDAAVMRLRPGAPPSAPQGATNVLWAYASLGRTPGAEIQSALDSAIARSLRDFNDQDVCVATWSYALLCTLRGVGPGPNYATLWDRVCGMDHRRLSDVGSASLFHAHIMGVRLPSGPKVEVSYPDWLTKDARDKWTRQTKDNIKVSSTHAVVGRVIEDAGFRVELERTTDDGCFSMDIYLPDHDIAVEIDGPTHFFIEDHAAAAAKSPDSEGPSLTTTPETELRDLFLSTYCAKVVSVPFTAARRHRTAAGMRELRAFVKEKLDAAVAEMNEREASGATSAATSPSGDDHNYPSSAGHDDRASAAATSAERAVAVACARWRGALPRTLAAKLDDEMAAVSTAVAKRLIVIESATKDTTKARAALRRALLEAHARSTELVAVE